MADRPLYKERRRVFLDSWSDANGWASLLRMIADRQETDPATAARRPKPPTLKEQALEALEHILRHSSSELGANTIRRALEQLDD